MSESEALSAALSDRTELVHIVRSDVKTTTWGQYKDAVARPGEQIVTGVPDGEVVRVVAVSGVVEPEFAHGLTFPWATFVYDANTGAPLGVHAEPTGTWPPFFANLGQ